MRVFKRGPEPGGDDAIAGFWAWWEGARVRVAGAIADGSVGSMVDEITTHVRAIDQRLAWELSKGAAAQHALIVTPEGDPAVRPAALTWLRAAPAADGTWEYHASRQPGPLVRLDFRGMEIDLAAFRVAPTWDGARRRADVGLWHPGLAAAPPDVREHIAYLFLDNLLGEEDVERWIGAIEVAEVHGNGMPPADLKPEIDRHAAASPDGSWTLATRDGGGDQAFVVVDLAIKPIDHPFRTHHLVVTVDRGYEQLSQSGETEALDAAEDRLIEAVVAEDAVYIGHVTERRRRRIHFMCARPDACRSAAAAWADAERQFGPRLDLKSDPGWTFRAEFGL